MSDCFDHEADAWDDACFGRSAEEGTSYRRCNSAFIQYPRRNHCDFCGEHGLEWAIINGRYKLVDQVTRRIHTCTRRH